MTPIIIQTHITREDLRAHPDRAYLFGDNLEQVGMGGQAGAMRGEPNAVGIPTKKAPGGAEGDYFTDDELDLNAEAIDRAFARIPKGRTVVIPAAGLGTGIAELPTRAPLTYGYLLEKIADLSKP